MPPVAVTVTVAEELQTPVIVMTDLDLGMNDHMSPPLNWNDKREYKRGKVLKNSVLRSGSLMFKKRSLGKRRFEEKEVRGGGGGPRFKGKVYLSNMF